MSGDLKKNTPGRGLYTGKDEQPTTRDHLLTAIIALPILFAVGILSLYISQGSNHRTLEIPWFTPMVSTFMSLTALTVAFLSFGRFHVLKDAISYWIGLAFAGFSIGLFYYVLAWPGLLPGGRSFIANLPNTAGWMSPLAISVPGLLLLAAALLPWPQKQALKGRWANVSILTWMGFIALMFTLIAIFEQNLPILVRSDGTFTPLLMIWNFILILVYLIGTVLSAQRYRITGDRLIGCVAFFQMALVFSPLLTILSGRRYDLWWYLGRGILVIGCLIVLFGLLFEYIHLFRRVLDSEAGYRQLSESLKAALAKAEAGSLRLEAVMQNVPIGMAITEGPPDFRISHVSQHGLKMNQGPVENLVDLPSGQHQANWNILLPDGVTRPLPEQMPLYRASRMGETVQNLELVMETQDGRRIPVLINAAPIRDEQGHIVAAINTWLDISERKRVEAALQVSEAAMDAFFEASPGILNLFDQDLRYIKTDPITPTYFGLDHHNIIGKSVKDLNPPFVEQFLGPMIERVTQSGQPELNLEVPGPIPSKQGEMGYWQVSYFLVPLPYGEKGLGVMGVDITDLKHAEEALAVYASNLERSNRDLQDFAFVASHDLQEPLRKIEAFGGLMLEKSEDLNDLQRDLLKRMRGSAQRMRSMVDGLLQLSRLETHAQPFQPVQLSQIVQEALVDLELQIRQTNGVIEVCQLPVIEADPSQMRRLFQNLISNALKFQPPDHQPHIKVCVGETEPGFVQIIVADNGIGFDEAHAGHLFEPFKRLVGRTRYEGSGMGLAICRKIVERHHGTIIARSQPGQGTKFLMTLPVYQAPSLPDIGRISKNGETSHVVDR